MRVPGLIFVVAIAFFGTGSIASAEKVKTNQEAKLFNHPGEQGAVLLHLKEGQTMTLLSEEGRWLKVRVQGRTGFVPRSKVDMPDNTTLARNTRRRPFVDGRSTHRGFDSGAGPDDRIGADATGDIATKDTGTGDDDDSSAKKPVTKKPAAKGDDDDDDDAKKPAAKKPAVKKPAAKGDDDDDDDAKKPAAKKPVAAKPKSKGDDDDDDDDSGKKPAAKKPVVAAKPAAKPKAKGDDDDDDDDSGKKPAAKKPVTVATKSPAKGDDDDDDDSGKKPAAKAKGGDDDDSKDAESDTRPHAHVDDKTKVYDERSKSSSVAFVAKPGDKLYVDSTKGDWTTIENDDGDTGWVLSSDVIVDGNSDGGNHKLAVNLNGGLGALFITQAMKTAGSTLTAPNLVPDQYTISASMAAISIGGDVYYPVAKKLFLGGELTYDGAKSVGGGIVYMGTDTGFTIHDVNLRAVLAYDFQKPSGMILLSHLGFRYRAYLVDNYSSAMANPAKVPQEVLEAPTIGAVLALPTLGKSYGLAFGLDAIVFGSSISQTAGLEDGSSPSVLDFRLSGQFLYRLNKTLNLLGAYNFEYGDYSFGTPPAQSTRGHTPTGNVSRGDMINALSVGVVYGF